MPFFPFGDRSRTRTQLLCVCGLLSFYLFSDMTFAVPTKPFELLIMHSGQVVRGAISGSQFGYTVKLANGSSLFVPLEQVRFQCADLEEAYTRMRDELPENTAASHIALARWCVTYKLLEQARDELTIAIQLEPERGETRSLLRRVNDLLKPNLPPLITQESAPRRSSLADIEFERAESLAGLSRDTAAQFARRIQPILMNNCSTASCHGPATQTEFRLNIVRVSTGANRHLAEKNLASVLEFVNLENPRASPLLTVITGNHGTRGRTLFRGAKGAEQLRELTDWVDSLAEERGSINLLADVSADPEPESSADEITPVVATEEDVTRAEIISDPNQRLIRLVPPSAIGGTTQALPRETSPRRRGTATRPWTTSRTLGSRTSPEPNFSGELRQPEPQDAFDPEVFNRETRNRERLRNREP